MDDTRRILQRGIFFWNIFGHARFVAGKLQIQIISIFLIASLVLCIVYPLIFVLYYYSRFTLKAAAGFHIKMVIHPIHSFVAIFLDYHLPDLCVLSMSFMK